MAAMPKMKPMHFEQTPQPRQPARSAPPDMHRDHLVGWVSRHNAALEVLRRVELLLARWRKSVTRLRRLADAERHVVLQYPINVGPSTPPAKSDRDVETKADRDAETLNPDRVYAQPSGDAMLSFLKTAPPVDARHDDRDFGDTD